MKFNTAKNAFCRYDYIMEILMVIDWWYLEDVRSIRAHGNIILWKFDIL